MMMLYNIVNKTEAGGSLIYILNILVIRPTLVEVNIFGYLKKEKGTFLWNTYNLLSIKHDGTAKRY